MLDHIDLYCHNASVTLPFYRACLAPLRIVVWQGQPQLQGGDLRTARSPIFR